MTILSQDFTLQEMTKSEYATRKNITEQFSPPSEVIENLKALCINILQPLEKAMLGDHDSIKVSSGYRCNKVNSKIGGAKNSQHLLGQAADITCKSVGNLELLKSIVHLGLPFDQLIYEFGESGWIHVSYSSQHRRQILKATKEKGKTVYLPLKL